MKKYIWKKNLMKGHAILIPILSPKLEFSQWEEESRSKKQEATDGS